MSYKRKLYYKGVRVNALGLPSLSNYKKEKKKEHARKRSFYHISFASHFKKDALKNLIVMYDIPEGRKKERDWFRRQLRNFDFVMIQRSVWVGPSPLPKEFLAYLKEINIGDNFKTFKLAKAYDNSISAIA